MTPLPETPNITIELTDPLNSALRCEVNTPNLQVAINMLAQALEEVRHAFTVDRQKREAAQMMSELQAASQVGQLMRFPPKGGH